MRLMLLGSRGTHGSDSEMCQFMQQCHKECVYIEVFVHRDSVPSFTQTGRTVVSKFRRSVWHNPHENWMLLKKIQNILPHIRWEMLPYCFIVRKRTC